MHINIAKDFSAEPAGRYLSDGPFSGEAFRENILLQSLNDNEKVIVNMEGLEGYGSSFLEESFGGLVRKGYFTSDQLHQKMQIKTDDQALIQEIWTYVDDAEED